MFACKNTRQTTEQGSGDALPELPQFSEDSALAYCAAQCEFGPRPMNSDAHEKCGEWIIEKFKQCGAAVVTTQKADLKGWDGTMLRSTNIIASINPEAQHRILICAHWDSRPWADNDPDESNHRKPIIAANDAASGVAVMLELCRVLTSQPVKKTLESGEEVNVITYGIDFVCFDAEDYGLPQWVENREDSEDTWALGAQYFAKNPPAAYEYGILLDMVGGQGAHFYLEGLSRYYANNVLEKVWQAAGVAGYSSYFLNQAGGTIDDDHKPLNEAGIPTIDIIPYYPDCEQSCFGPTWHTLDDDMSHIDKNTLKAVGQTLMQFLHSNAE